MLWVRIRPTPAGADAGFFLVGGPNKGEAIMRGTKYRGWLGKGGVSFFYVEEK